MNATGNGTVPQGNGTTPVRPCVQILRVDAISGANIALLFVLFVALGMTVSFKDFKSQFKKPTALVLSQLGQFLLLPLVGWGMAEAFDLPPAHAVGLVTVTTAPGGAVSNIIALLYQADIPLSIAATAASAILAIGFMPLNQYIYLIATNIAPGVCISIPGIVLSAAIIVIGSVVGMLVKPFLKNRKWFNSIRLLYFLGTASAIAIVVMGFVVNMTSSAPLTTLPGLTVLATILPCLVGMIWGLLAGRLMNVSKPACVVIALEVGLQNKVVAISALAFIFPPTSAARAQSFAIPIMYALFSTIFSLVWVGVAWKLGWTNLPRDKGFIEAYRIARLTAAEERKKDIYGNDAPAAVASSAAVTSSSEQGATPKSEDDRQVAVV